MFTDGLMSLHRAGKVTNDAKSVFNGVSITTFALGSAELYAWLDENEEVALFQAACEQGESRGCDYVETLR